MLSDVLKRKDLYDYFSRSAFEKAHAYQAQGRVKGLEVSGDLTHLRARVRGSGSNEYRVDIQLEFSGDQLSDLDGECSCPMTFNCKHVAATLLEAAGGKPHPRLDALAAEVPAGSDGVLCLPYFLGEKTPIQDPLARGIRFDTEAHGSCLSMSDLDYTFALDDDLK